jgi:hypothetical protein
MINQWKLSADGKTASRPLGSGTESRAIGSIDPSELANALPPDPVSKNQIVGDINDAVQAALDEKARAKGYKDAATCISYMSSTNAAWKADAAAMNTWRDLSWAYAFTQEALATLPAPAAVVAGLPTAPW